MTTQETLVRQGVHRGLDAAHVVVVGASNRPSNAGQSYVRAFRAARFPGRLSVVNRAAEAVRGAQGYASIADLPSAPDLAVLALPAERVPAAVTELGQIGAGLVHCFSGGFAERGGAEVARQERLACLATEAGVALLGPNCMGVYRPKAGLAFRPDLPMRDGNIALVSQSGGVTIAALHQLDARGLGISTAVSYGNGAALAGARLAEMVVEADAPTALGVYVEDANEPDFLPARARLAQRTRVVLCVGPRVARAHLAAQRHTGLTGGSWPAFADIPEEVTMVGRVDDFVGALGWLSERTQRRPRTALVTISGGVGVLAVSELEESGVRLCQPTVQTRRTIEALSPGGLIVADNPVDLGVSYLSRKVVARTLEALRRDPEVELTMFHLVWDHLVEVDRASPGYADGFLSLLIQHAQRGDDLTVLFPRMTDDDSEREARRTLRQAGVHVVDSVGEVAAALATP